MKFEKRLLSLLLAFVLVISCLGIGIGKVKANAVQAVQYGSIGWQIHTKNNATVNTYGTDREVTIRINYSDGTAQNNSIVNPGGGGDGTYADWFESNETNSGTINNVIISKSISSFVIILGPGGDDNNWPSDDNWTFDSAYIYFTPAGGTKQTVASDTGTHELANVGDSYTLGAPTWFANHNHTLSFDANGGSGSTSLEYVYGATLPAPVVTRTGYTLSGWSPVLPASAPDSDATYVAQWSANANTVVFDAAGGTVNPASKVVYFDSTYGAGGWPTPVKTGYTFEGWYTGIAGQGTQIFDSTIVALTSGQTLYAKWLTNTYTVKYDGNASTSGSTPDSMHTYNITTALNTNEYHKLGHSFLGWSLSQSAVLPEYLDAQSVINLTSEPSGIVQLFAVWKVNDYQLLYNANGGSGTMPAQTMTFGHSITLNTVVFGRTGHTFEGWAISQANADAGIVSYSNGANYTMNTEGLTLFAVWSTNSYRVIFDANGGTGGSIESMHYGEVLVAPVVSRTGYLFLGWVPFIPATVPANDVTYTAEWAIFSYTITFDANGGTGGSISTLTYGTPLAAPAVAKPGYTFAGWSPAVPATVPDFNATYVAQWNSNNVTVAFNLNGGTGTVPDSQSGVPGSTVSLPVQGNLTKQFYNFLGWATSPSATEPLANYAIPAVNITLYAVWGRVPVSLTAIAGSTTIINQSKGFIFGLQEGLSKNDFSNNYIKINGDGSLRVSYFTDSFGSQTKVELIDNVTSSVVKTYYIVIFGDVDGDGYITVGDENLISLVASYQSTFDTGSAFEFAADLTQDELVDTFDLNLISAVTSYTGTIDQTNPGELI